MERLTKRNNDGTAIAPEFADETYLMQDDHDRFTGYINSPIVDRLAELEDKMENGILIELPCKVGDTVWVVYEDDDREYKIYEAKCVGFAFENGTNIRIVTNFCCYDFYRKGTFTDKSEAEQKLKELQGE